MEPFEIEPFTVGDLLGDAWRSFRRTVATHLQWNGVFLALLLVSVCGLSCAMVPMIGVMGAAGGGGGEGGVALVLVLYAVLLAVMLGLMALHQAVTLAITAADLRGEPIRLAEAFRAGVARAPAMAGALFLRICADMLVWLVAMGAAGGAAVAAVGTGWRPDAMDPTQVAGLVAAFLLAYAVAIAWTLVVRSFLGLSGPCVQNEEIGPFAAMTRSIALLSGRRLQHIGMRVAWGAIAIALYLVTYAPAALVLALPQLLGREAAFASLLIFPYFFVWYFFVLHLLSVDTVLEGAVYARLTRKQTTAELADVFA